MKNNNKTAFIENAIMILIIIVLTAVSAVAVIATATAKQAEAIATAKAEAEYAEYIEYLNSLDYVELSAYFDAKQETKTTEEIEILTAKLIDYNNSLIDYNKQQIMNNKILIAVNDYKIQQLETEIAIYSNMVEAIQENNS